MNHIDIVAINRIRTTTDGEGVTTLVVSMGCPLRCAYCINPMTWDGSMDSFKKYTAEELYNELKIDNLYYLATGGGVMFGGGEPLLNIDFIASFIDKYKDTGWKFSMETSLSVDREKLDKAIDRIDFFIVDSKDMNKERYELYTKGNYDLFVSNLKYLLEKVGSERIQVRVPAIPVFHQHEEYKDNAKILMNMGFNNIEIFEYINPSMKKKISDTAKQNCKEFLEKINSK